MPKRKKLRYGNNVTGILNDYSDEFKVAFDDAISEALIEIGKRGAKHAKEIIIEEDRIDTGRMRDSMTYAPTNPTDYVTIGTNVEYAIYQELGTSRGIKPARFMSRAAYNFKEEYKRIMEEYLGAWDMV